VFVSVVAVPVLQLFVEQHDVTKLIPAAFIFVVPGVQYGEHEYLVDGGNTRNAGDV
jgi:hypothetical protein